jgi:hypothetical protein
MKKNYSTTLKICFLICNFLLILVLNSFNLNDNDYQNRKDLIVPSSAEDSWWNPRYKHRAPIDIFNEYKSPLPNGYSVKVSINTAILISEGKVKTDGRDLRIAWYDSSIETWFELARFIETGFNTDDTQIWFKTQTRIDPNSHDTNYYFYYGNEDTDEPPTDKNKIFDFYDDFNQPDGDAEGWTVTHGESWQVINKEYVENELVLDRRTILDSYSVENASIEVHVKSSGENFGAGVMFRYSDENNFFTAGIGFWEYEVAIGKWIKGDPSILGITETTEDVLINDRWYKLRIDAFGSNHLVYLDDVLKNKIIEEEHLNAGQIGFMTWTDSAKSYFDDLRIRLLVPTEPILTLGVEESYEFSITLISYAESIPSNEEIVIQFMIIASNGVKNATLYFGYDIPYNQYSVSGYNSGEDIWEFMIPPQGDSNEDSILVFCLVAYDNGDPPDSEIDDNSGLHFSINIIDDDTTGPEIGSPTYPLSISSNEPIIISCTIFDPSDVSVTLKYGYDHPYNQINIGGTNLGENNWQFTVPPQGEENEGKVLNFFIIAVDEDNSPETTIADNEGAYYSIEISEDGGETPLIIISGYLSEWIITFLFLGVIFIFIILFKRKLNSSLKLSHQ